MNRSSSFLGAISLVIVLGAVLAVAWVDPRTTYVVEQLAQSCLQFYPDNPSVGAVLIAAVIALPTGYLLALIWPRRGLFSTFSGKR